jgi:hypothetical protein
LLFFFEDILPHYPKDLFIRGFPSKFVAFLCIFSYDVS